MAPIPFLGIMLLIFSLTHCQKTSDRSPEKGRDATAEGLNPPTHRQLERRTGQSERAENGLYFYCPMHPFIVRRNARAAPCPCCSMPFSKIAIQWSMLHPEDERLLEAQCYSCPIDNQTLLSNSKQPPIKVTLQGRQVFVCGKDCEAKALAKQDETLARVKKLQAKHQAYQLYDFRLALAKLGPDDRQLAEAQVFCPVQSETRIGSQGRPFRLRINGRTMLLCCEQCAESARANPERTIARLEVLGTQSKAEQEWNISGSVWGIGIHPNKKTVVLCIDDNSVLMPEVMMEFAVADPGFMAGLKDGDRVDGRLKAKSGDYVITRLKKK
jgi:Cu/Ag efflux protein CusF